MFWVYGLPQGPENDSMSNGFYISWSRFWRRDKKTGKEERFLRGTVTVDGRKHRCDCTAKWGEEHARYKITKDFHAFFDRHEKQQGLVS